MRSEAQMDAAIAKAIEVLEAAEKQFTAYAEHHHAKGPSDPKGFEKAATNYTYSLKCGDALQHLRLVYNQPWR